MMSAELAVFKGELVGSINEFQRLDNSITERLRDFAQLGNLLIQMRDGQSYRAAGFNSFADYCRSKAGLSYRHAQEKIQRAIVFDALKGACDRSPLPETEEHVRQLAAVANWVQEEREVTKIKPDGTEVVQKVKQPVGVKNPAKIAEVWSSVTRAFEKKKAEAEAEGKKLPVFSGNFIRNHLPNEYKVAKDRGFNCNPLVNLTNRLEKLCEWMKSNGCDVPSRMEKLVLTEPPALGVQLQQLKDAAHAASAMLDSMIDVLDEYEEVDCDSTEPPKRKR